MSSFAAAVGASTFLEREGFATVAVVRLRAGFLGVGAMTATVMGPRDEGMRGS